MITPKNLLNDLKRLLRGLETDIRERADTDEATDARLRREHAEARKAERTAATFNVWRDEQVTQAAVAWILGCVFVRFLEDNELLSAVWLAGPGERLQLARDQETVFFRGLPTGSERDYLEHVFHETAKLPTLAEVFAEAHNPLWHLPPSGDGARGLVEFFRKTNPDTGELHHDFTDPDWNTRFLGDLYQDLSESARKTYALLQTPEFVEEFILDRTLDPAIGAFGLREVRLIDPTCGSGHFLLGAFRRLLDQWLALEPGTNVRALVQRALDAVYGVDLNPFAVAIARFRLLVEALRACAIRKLEHALAFRFHLAVGDSLLHGFTRQPFMPGFEESDPIGFVYETEDADELRRIFRQKYHAVVGNPPYITVKDKVLNQAYRDRYGSCSGKYSLVVPFMERFFGLALPPAAGTAAGCVGMITANSFMKREFGKKLVEEYIPKWDLTHVIDTSGAYIPGHGTPTVILFGQNRKPVADTIRAALGIRGEPGTPDDPARGEVWSAILDQIDRPGSESDYVSVSDVPRERFATHPWSIGGGGASEGKASIEAASLATLRELSDYVGIGVVTLEDDAFVFDASCARRLGYTHVVGFGYGDVLRDWGVKLSEVIVFPYRHPGYLPFLTEGEKQVLWPLRADLQNRTWFRKTQKERGLEWFEYGHISRDKLSTPLSIAFAFVATHNHFVLDRGGKVFNRTAPVIKLLKDATEEQHLELLGLLDSSTACFWGRQIFFPRGGFASGKWEERLEWDGTKLGQFPIPAEKPLALPRELDRLGQELAGIMPTAVVARWHGGNGKSLRGTLREAETRFVAIRERMIALQEELDWQCYHLYGLTEKRLWLENLDSVPPLKLGERPFEILLARQVEAGEEETTWFERHGSTPVTEPPKGWPGEYLRLHEQRQGEMQRNQNLALIEKPEYKRRWQVEPWEKQVEQALREWLANRLEKELSGRDLMLEGAEGERKREREREGREEADAKAQRREGTQRKTEEGQVGERQGTTSGQDATSTPSSPSSLCESLRLCAFASKDPELLSCAQLADRLQTDALFQEVATLYTGRPDFNLTNLVTKLVEDEGVPNLPRDRYKESGLRKRADWEQVWEMQREEDRLEEAKRELTQRREDAKERKEEGEVGRIDADLREVEAMRAALDIPVPPKYQSADFAKTGYWRLRGKLDVPKERFILYPGCEREGDPTPVLTWAGWNHLQQAGALAAWYTHLQDSGAAEPRLLRLLAGLADLLPWLKQWHNDIDSVYQERMGDFYQEFAEGEARRHGTTLEGLRG